MKIAIINVSLNEPYTLYQQRLRETCKKLNADLLFWTDELPEGSKPHSESLYGFKVFAFQEAFKKGYDVVLWLDSPTEILGDIDWIFKAIDKDEYFVTNTAVTLSDYVNDRTLSYFGLTREQIRETDWKLNYGYVFGFKKDSEFFNEFKRCEELGLFSSAEEDYAEHCTLNKSFIEHRHEESVISLIVQTKGIKLTDYSLVGKLFNYEKTPI